MTDLLVITGAGASFGCTTARGSEARTPLVDSLFAPEYRGVLQRHRLVQTIEAQTRHLVEDRAIELEGLRFKSSVT